MTSFDEALEELLAAVYPDGIPIDQYPRLLQILEAACRLADSSKKDDTIVVSPPPTNIPDPGVSIPEGNRKQPQKPTTKLGRPSGLPKDSDLIPDIVAKREAGASIRDIHRWLHEQGVRVSHTTIDSRIKDAMQKRQEERPAPTPSDDDLEPPEPNIGADEEHPEDDEPVRRVPRNPHTEELRQMAINMGVRRAVDVQAPARGREIRGDEEVTERYSMTVGEEEP